MVMKTFGQHLVLFPGEELLIVTLKFNRTKVVYKKKKKKNQVSFELHEKTCILELIILEVLNISYRYINPQVIGTCTVCSSFLLILFPIDESSSFLSPRSQQTLVTSPEIQFIEFSYFFLTIDIATDNAIITGNMIINDIKTVIKKNVNR